MEEKKKKKKEKKNLRAMHVRADTGFFVIGAFDRHGMVLKCLGLVLASSAFFSSSVTYRTGDTMYDEEDQYLQSKGKGERSNIISKNIQQLAFAGRHRPNYYPIGTLFDFA